MSPRIQLDGRRLRLTSGVMVRVQKTANRVVKRVEMRRQGPRPQNSKRKGRIHLHFILEMREVHWFHRPQECGSLVPQKGGKFLIKSQASICMGVLVC
jgi:hypothetical protein